MRKVLFPIAIAAWRLVQSIAASALAYCASHFDAFAVRIGILPPQTDFLFADAVHFSFVRLFLSIAQDTILYIAAASLLK